MSGLKPTGCWVALCATVQNGHISKQELAEAFKTTSKGAPPSESQWRQIMKYADNGDEFSYTAFVKVVEAIKSGKIA